MAYYQVYPELSRNALRATHELPMPGAWNFLGFAMGVHPSVEDSGLTYGDAGIFSKGCPGSTGCTADLTMGPIEEEPAVEVQTTRADTSVLLNLSTPRYSSSVSS